MAQVKQRTIQRTTEIAAPVDKVFEYYAHPVNQVEVWPSLVEVRNLQHDENGHPTTYDWTYKMAGMRFEGTGRVIEYEPNRRFTTESKGGVDSRISATFEERGGTTVLHEEVEYEIPSTLLGRFAVPFLIRINENELKAIHENLKARMEG